MRNITALEERKMSGNFWSPFRGGGGNERRSWGRGEV